MNLSARTQYACLAILELTRRHERDEPVPLRQIADTHGIPMPFLVQILQQLRAAGIVESTRGASGGYRLTRKPSALTLGEVVAATEGSSSQSLSVDESSPVSRVLADAWREAERAQRHCLDRISFSQLADRARENADVMYYI